MLKNKSNGGLLTFAQYCIYTNVLSLCITTAVVLPLELKQVFMRKSVSHCRTIYVTTHVFYH